jgi:hypothetical protein
MKAVDQLLAICPPPPRASDGGAGRWNRAEEALGTRLPADYKLLVNIYGPGSFDGFLWVLQPCGSNKNLDLVGQASVRLQSLRELAALGETVPYDIGVGDSGILPWAITDNGDVCYWAVTSAEPGLWQVTINDARSAEWREYPTSATEFLTGVLSSRLSCPIFPDDFPSVNCVFVPAPHGR